MIVLSEHTAFTPDEVKPLKCTSYSKATIPIGGVAFFIPKEDIKDMVLLVISYFGQHGGRGSPLCQTCGKRSTSGKIASESMNYCMW